eukprot:5429345-Pyramimonas_sp.AAC.1
MPEPPADVQPRPRANRGGSSTGAAGCEASPPRVADGPGARFKAPQQLPLDALRRWPMRPLPRRRRA